MTMLSWPAWGGTARLSVSHPAALRAAHRLATAVLTRSERAADVRNPHAELHRLDGSAGRPVRVSRRLAAMVSAAVEAARRSDGLVDPTVGNAVVLTEHVLAERTRPPRRAGPAGHHPVTRWTPVCGGTATPIARPARGWQSVDVNGRYVTIPANVLLDLSAIGRAATVQHCAQLIHRRLGVGVLLGLGGDIATAGRAPVEGWAPQGGLEPVLGGDGVATVTGRVVDPRTGGLAPRPWPTIAVRRSAAEGGIVAAKTLAMAAAVVGAAAAPWLDDHGVGPTDRLLLAPDTRSAGAGQRGPTGTVPPDRVGRLPQRPQPAQPHAHLLRPAG